MISKLMTTLAVSCALGSSAFALDPHTSGTKGQPSQSCSVTMVTPGHAATARGAAFNPKGVAGAVYANPTSRGGIAAGHSHVVAQYYGAGFQQTTRVAKQSGRRLHAHTRGAPKR